MYINNHTHIDDGYNYIRYLEIIGFSCLSCILGVVFQKYCNTTRVN